MTEKRETCWRSECQNGCYYPRVCDEKPIVSETGVFREEWGIQQPPSVWVGRSYPARTQAETQLRFAPGGRLVHRFVTEWEADPALRSDPNQPATHGAGHEENTK